jgi:hypothetical protein
LDVLVVVVERSVYQKDYCLDAALLVLLEIGSLVADEEEWD